MLGLTGVGDLRMSSVVWTSTAELDCRMLQSGVRKREGSRAGKVHNSTLMAHSSRGWLKGCDEKSLKELHRSPEKYGEASITSPDGKSLSPRRTYIITRECVFHHGCVFDDLIFAHKVGGNATAMKGKSKERVSPRGCRCTLLLPCRG